MAINDTLYQLK